MLFLSWSQPSPEQQKACIAKSGGSFNYDSKFRGASANEAPNPSSSQELRRGEEEALFKDGFFINRARVLLGSGPRTFESAKAALQSWRHFDLGWAFVDAKTPVEKGASFCVCVKEFLPWIMMPLQVAYVANSSGYGGAGRSSSNAIRACFGFGSGTLQGHLLAGEERFSVEWDENDQVWYDIFSFSKPAHFLSIIGSPYVQLRQKYFAQQSAKALLKHIRDQPTSM